MRTLNFVHGESTPQGGTKLCVGEHGVINITSTTLTDANAIDMTLDEHLQMTVCVNVLREPVILNRQDDRRWFLWAEICEYCTKKSFAVGLYVDIDDLKSKPYIQIIEDALENISPSQITEWECSGDRLETFTG